MGRKRPENKRSKIVKVLIEEYQPQNIQDLEEVLDDLYEDILEEISEEKKMNT